MPDHPINDLKAYHAQFAGLSPAERDTATAWMIGKLSTQVSREVWNDVVKEAIEVATHLAGKARPKESRPKPRIDRKSAAAGEREESE